MNVAIIGAGLIGNKRANAIGESDSLMYVFDTDSIAADILARTHNALVVAHVDLIFSDPLIDIVIIAVINKYIAGYAEQALRMGKHILCEKPLGRNYKESKRIVEASIKYNRIVKTGFNHRFHPALLQAKNIVETGKIGRIMNIRAHYGHGGRPGMESEWRCSKDLCGGGELLDQGVHLIDLCQWLVKSKVKQVFGKVTTSFWKIEVEDNAFIHLQFDDDVIAHCHVSWTNWKNSFVFEIFGTNGYILIDGLGGSYGTESLEVGIRNRHGGRPKINVTNFDSCDNSWQVEWEEFIEALSAKRAPVGNGIDGLSANRIIEKIYESSLSGSLVTI